MILLLLLLALSFVSFHLYQKDKNPQSSSQPVVGKTVAPSSTNSRIETIVNKGTI
jgi:positive regulator of sigma E activity